MLITPTSAIVGSIVGIGGAVACVANYETKQSKQRQAEAEARHRSDNTMRMFNEWLVMASSREAVFHKRYNNNDGYFDLHKLIAMGNRSKVDQGTPAPESVANVMGFFLSWRSLEKSDTINSADLKKRIGSQLATFHKVLAEIRDEEAKGWHKTDFDNLNKVVDFLNDISKMETEG